MCPDYSGDWEHTVMAPLASFTVQPAKCMTTKDTKYHEGRNSFLRVPSCPSWFMLLPRHDQKCEPTLPTLRHWNQIRTYRKFKIESLSPPVLECGCQRLKNFPGRVDGLGSPDSGQRPGSA